MAIPRSIEHRQGQPARLGSLFDGAAACILGLYVLLLVLVLGSSLAYLDPNDFRAVFQSRDLLFALRLSLLTSFLAAAASLTVAVPAAYTLNRFDFRGKGWVDTLVDTPIVLPPLVMGVVLLVFFQTPIGRAIERMVPFVYEPAGIVLAQFMVVCPYAIRSVKAAFDSIDKRMEDVSRTLGWSPGQVFLRVTLPMIRSGILAGGVISWALSMGLYGPMMVFAGTTRQKTEVLATSIYLELSIGQIGTALAISLLMVALAMITLLVFKRLVGRGYGLW